MKIPLVATLSIFLPSLNRLFCRIADQYPKPLSTKRTLSSYPWPWKPADYPETRQLVEKYLGQVPILGICLGFQLLLENEGGKIVRQSQVLHGVCTEIRTHTDSLTYRGLPLDKGCPATIPCKWIPILLD